VPCSHKGFDAACVENAQTYAPILSPVKITRTVAGDTRFEVNKNLIIVFDFA
jgi:hypothetical protein